MTDEDRMLTDDELLASLDDALEEGVSKPTPEQRYGGTVAGAVGAWEIDGERTADWALLRRQRAKDAGDRARALAAEQIEKINAWLARETKRHDRDVAFFTDRLVAYQEARLAAQPKAGPLRLPNGTVSVKVGQVSTNVTDEQATADWVQENVSDPDELLEATVKVKKNELKKRYGGKVEKAPGEYHAVTPDGEIVPGVMLERGRPSITVTGGDDDGEGGA